MDNNYVGFLKDQTKLFRVLGAGFLVNLEKLIPQLDGYARSRSITFSPVTAA
jgi:hypothetical protein